MHVCVGGGGGGGGGEGGGGGGFFNVWPMGESLIATSGRNH